MSAHLKYDNMGDLHALQTEAQTAAHCTEVSPHTAEEDVGLW